ncbi:ANTAR domain-containing protein [Williamsia muralis]|uniref:ANTAR domain-containing protein n=1 Tax=Williamsia marianensis TaxID=85044 RepID=A0ABU4EQD4_WILMA|nr:ANTAR domain-containing protein [Williamsia muralis]MDV7133474.1 ANTAR domain-containing protein [Williamsia muralis]
MKSNSQLVAALASLTAGLDDPTVDLHQRLAELVAALTESIDSLVSVALTVVVDHRPFSVAVPVRKGVEAITSVSIPLRRQSGPDTESRLVLLAGTPGAFVDLVADVSLAMNSDPATIDVDTQLPPAVPFENDPGVAMQRDLEDRSAIDQALGVLLARGATMQAASTHLSQRAEGDNVSMADAARAVLDDAVEVLRPDI